LVGLSASGATAVASDEQLEEVLVTARRTVENAQDVPVAVTALSAERLANHDINTLEKLADALPDLILTRGNSGSRLDISLRGIGPNFSSIRIPVLVGFAILETPHVKPRRGIGLVPVHMLPPTAPPWVLEF
jgi:outer membrane receptor protein involved in Fe transport